MRAGRSSCRSPCIKSCKNKRKSSSRCVLRPSLHVVSLFVRSFHRSMVCLPIAPQGSEWALRSQEVTALTHAIVVSGIGFGFVSGLGPAVPARGQELLGLAAQVSRLQKQHLVEHLHEARAHKHWSVPTSTTLEHHPAAFT